MSEADAPRPEDDQQRPLRTDPLDEAAPAEAREDGHDRQEQQDDVRRPSDRPIASVAKTVMTTMTVFTGSV